MNQTIPIVAVHGFLGRPSDWDLIGFEHARKIDVFQDCNWKTMWEWSERLNNTIKEPSLLMGYSLGGRLALHALVQRPSNWQAAIIISAHPGLTDDYQKKERLKIDLEWAQRFETEDWKSLMQAWNQRTVFAHDQFHFQRDEQHYQRSSLSHVLQQASLGRQDNLKEKIAQLPFPILWLVGKQDEVYKKLTHSFIFTHPQSAVKIIKGAGHRLPWERPEEFKSCVKQFLANLT